MNSRLYFEAIAAAIWGTPVVLVGLLFATSSMGRVAEKSQSPDLGTTKPTEVQLPKVHDQFRKQDGLKSSSPAQATSEPQPLDELPVKNAVEQTIQSAEELTSSQREAIIDRYRMAQREGKFNLEIARTDGSLLNRIGEYFLVRTELVARCFDKTGFACQLSKSRQSGLSIRLQENQIPIQVREAIRTDADIRNSLQTQYQLILNSVVEIELYRSLYSFVNQHNLPSPIPGHRYQANVAVSKGTPVVVWHDLGQVSVEHR